MRARWIVPPVFIAVGLLVLSAVRPAAQQAGNPPGLPTQARIHVTNRGQDEAVPVVLLSGGEVQPVAVVSAPVISLAPNTLVSTEARVQRWEYRVLAAKSSDDLAPALDKAGLDGWEAVGALPGPAADVRVLLKRPR